MLYRLPNNTALLVTKANFEPNPIIVNINKLKPYQFYNEDQLVTITPSQSTTGQVALHSRTKVPGQDGKLYYMQAYSNNHGGHNHQQGEGPSDILHRDDAHESNTTRGDIEAHVIEVDPNKNRHFDLAEQGQT
jgi:hypothetical protein